MSSVYVSQPGTKGKVVLKTSAGDVEIELWPKECPKACRNFVQLCMEGYYDNTLFHRIIPKFIVQGGDPTGTGFGGESIYGKPFADEFHSRLKFNQRGLLAMANTGPDTNTSQFFFTLAAAPSLNGKNTIFGKVVGNTVFNVLNLGELDTDKNDKPIYDAKILSCQILSNPFDDIIPRERKPAQEESSKPIAPTKVKGKKNFNLLSFEKDDIEVKDSESVKIRSSHDVLQSETLSKEKSYDGGHDKSKSTVSDTKKRKEVEENEQEQYDSKMKSKVLEKKLKVVEESKNQTKLSDVQEQIRKLQGEIKGIGVPKKEVEVKKKQDKSTVSQIRNKYLQSGKAVRALRKDIKGDVEVKLNGFKEMLEKSKKEEPAPTKVVELVDKDWECSLHFIKNCSSCRDTFGQEESDDDEGWMNATLKFEKVVGANVYEPRVEDYTIEDPRQGMKADIFGRDIQAPGDLKNKKNQLWTDKSTRKVKPLLQQWLDGPDDRGYQ